MIIKDKKANVGKSKKLPSIIIVILCWLMIIVVFSVVSPYFLRFNNIMNLIQYSAVSGVAACGFTLVILAGCLDLSAGTLSAMASIYAARVIEITDSPILGILAGILVGVAGGCLNGILITKVRINPLIITLGTMTIFQGIANLENNGLPIAIYNTTFKKIGQGYVFNGTIPNLVIIMFAFFAASFVLLKYSKFGREVYSIGGNAQASYVSGINVKAVRFKIFLTCSACAGCSGVLYAALTGSGSPSANTNMALDSISSIILGGAALTGGRGTIFGTLVGVLLIGTIENGLTLLGISSFYQMIVKGAILIVAVFVDVVKGQGAYE